MRLPEASGGLVFQNLFPIVFSRNGLLGIEKWDDSELLEQLILGCCADLPNGREWVESRHRS